MYGLKVVKNGTSKDTIQYNIYDLKEYIQEIKKDIKKLERQIVTQNRILQANIDKLAEQELLIKKCVKGKFVNEDK